MYLLCFLTLCYNLKAIETNRFVPCAKCTARNTSDGYNPNAYQRFYFEDPWIPRLSLGDDY